MKVVDTVEEWFSISSNGITFFPKYMHHGAEIGIFVLYIYVFDKIISSANVFLLQT
jgi:hypothetical protein